MLKFEAWLRKQKKRDDRVGDLAIDFINSRDKKITLENLSGHHTCTEAKESFKEAVEEYLLYIKQILMK